MVLRTTLGRHAPLGGAAQPVLARLGQSHPGPQGRAARHPDDAKGLLKAAIRDDNPVVFFEDKIAYATCGPVPEEEYVIPFGVADVKREGSDMTIVATSSMVYVALERRRPLEADGISAEVVDPRTIVPARRATR